MVFNSSLQPRFTVDTMFLVLDGKQKKKTSQAKTSKYNEMQGV